MRGITNHNLNAEKDKYFNKDTPFFLKVSKKSDTNVLHIYFYENTDENNELKRNISNFNATDNAVRNIKSLLYYNENQNFIKLSIKLTNEKQLKNILDFLRFLTDTYSEQIRADKHKNKPFECEVLIN